MTRPTKLTMARPYQKWWSSKNGKDIQNFSKILLHPKIPHTIPDPHVKPTGHVITRTVDSAAPHTVLNLCVGATHQLSACTAAHKNFAATCSILLVLHALPCRRQHSFQSSFIATTNTPPAALKNHPRTFLNAETTSTFQLRTVSYNNQHQNILLHS